MKLSFLNLTDLKIPQDFFERVLKAVEKNEKKRLNATLELVLLGEGRIRNINKRFAGKNKVTDVLSFPAVEIKKPTKKELAFDKEDHNRKFSENFVFPKNEEMILGEILLCPSRIKKQAKKLKKSCEEELAFCFVHGILHLFGYDHKEKGLAQKMEAEEKKIMELLRI